MPALFRGDDLRARIMTTTALALSLVVGPAPGGLVASSAGVGHDGVSIAPDRPTWVLETPPRSPNARHRGMATYDSAAQRVVMYGGAGPANDDTWTWDGHRWREVHSTARPPARGSAAFAYDPARDEVVLYGGMTSGKNVMRDTWVLKDGQWELRYADSPPGSSYDISMGFDPHLQQLVLAGVDGGRETWTWDGTTWTELHPAHTPETRDDDLVYDPVHDGLVLFASGETWLWDGADWELLDLNESPPRRANGELATWRGRVVLVGGLAGAEVLGDTWVLRRHRWIRVRTDGVSPARFVAVMSTHEARDEVMLFGGFDNPYGPDTNSTFTLRR